MRAYFGETVTVLLADGECVDATVAYADDTPCDRLLAVFGPNPMLGGDSDNNVVQALLEEGVARGWVAMTVDYRGLANGCVGGVDLMTYWERLASACDYALIVDDALHAIREVQREMSLGDHVAVAGYSFGTLIALRSARALALKRAVGISPPLEDVDLTPALGPGLEVNILAATTDPFCPLEKAKSLLEPLSVTLHHIPCEDHFFRGVEKTLARKVLDTIMCL